MPPPLVQIAVAIGLVIAAIGLGITGLGAWPGLPNPKGPIATALLGGFLLALGLAWWIFVPSFGARTLAANAANALSLIDKEALRLEGAASLNSVISFQCSQSNPPATYREDKTLYLVTFQGVPTKGMEHRGQVAGPSSFPRMSGPFNAGPYGDWYRCDVINYGNKPLRNIRARFPVQFLEVLPTDSGFQSGRVLAEGNALTPPFDLAAGSHSADHFYFRNTSPAFVSVSYPAIAQAQTLDSDQLHEIRLVPPSREQGGFIMLPLLKGPPTSPNQIPMPSAHPSP